MNPFFLQIQTFAEGSGLSVESSDTEVESRGQRLVPNEDSEFGYEVQEGAGVAPIGTGMTEEQVYDFYYAAQETFVPFSDQVSVLFSLVAGICLVVLSGRFLELRFGRGRLLRFLIPTAIAFFLFLGRKNSTMLGLLASSSFILDFVFLFLFVNILYRGYIGKKLYLTITFQALFELIVVLHVYTKLFLDRLLSALKIHMPDHELRLYSVLEKQDYRPGPVILVTYFDWIECLLLVLSCLFLILSVRKLARGMRQDAGNIPRNELFFLLMPAFTGIVFFIFTSVGHLLLSNSVFVEWATWGKLELAMFLYFLIPFLAFITILCILYAYDIYRKLIAYVEDKNKAAILSNQMEQMQSHIREIEQLYTGIRSMRHDMHNYLFDIKSLLAVRGIDVEEPGSELAAYFSGISTTLDTLKFSLHTGNPVTDVVLNGKYQQAKSQGIQFCSEFQFPSGYGIDVFDISIILNNALGNALEACEALRRQNPEAEAYIYMVSYHKNNMFLIEVENSFDGIVLERESGALPKTRKKDAAQHGLGLQNIMRCAEKYLGSAKHTYDGQKFHLTVMLQKTQEADNPTENQLMGLSESL